MVVGLLAWRIASAPGLPPLPADLVLPAGESLTGYAQNPAWTVLITTDAAGVQRLHLLAAGSGRIRQTVEIGTAD